MKLLNQFRQSWLEHKRAAANAKGCGFVFHFSRSVHEAQIGVELRQPTRNASKILKS